MPRMSPHTHLQTPSAKEMTLQTGIAKSASLRGKRATVRFKPALWSSVPGAILLLLPLLTWDYPSQPARLPPLILARQQLRCGSECLERC